MAKAVLFNLIPINMAKINRQLKNLRKAVRLDKTASEEMRALLMSKIENGAVGEGQTRKHPISLISIFTPSVRAVIVSLVVVLIPGGGFTTVRAALSSLPGDLLYPVKITTEKIHVALVSGQDDKTQLRVEFAERRLQEAEEIISKEENGEKEDKVALAVEKFNEEIETITENLENLGDESQKVVEDKIALLSGEVEKITQAIDAANEETDKTSLEVVVDEGLDEIPSNLDEDFFSDTITSVVPQIIKPVEPVDPPESFKIQLQIIKE